MSLRRQLLALAIILLATPAVAETREEPATVAFARISGKCSTLRVAGRGFACRAVSFYQTEIGRANFTIVLDDPSDSRHIITFSGDNGRRQDNTYELPVDRMLLKSKDRPKMDGLPVPAIETSTGMCRQLGSFVSGQISSIACHATDQSGRTYEVAMSAEAIPFLESALPVLGQHGRSDHDYAHLLIPLSVAGFYGDTKTQRLYLDRAMAVLSVAALALGAARLT